MKCEVFDCNRVDLFKQEDDKTEVQLNKGLCGIGTRIFNESF